MAIVLDGTNGITTETGTGDVSVGDDLIFTGTGNRITGDFSNATIASRVAFQTSTANSSTAIIAIPNGTSNVAALDVINSSNPTNASRARISIDNTNMYLASAINGTGSYLPMTFLTGGSERVRIDTSGNVGIGTSSPIAPLTVSSVLGVGAGNPCVVLQGGNNTERIAIRAVETVPGSGNGTAVFLASAARGTIASPTATLSGDALGYYQLGGYTGTAWTRGAWVSGIADGNWSGSNLGSHLTFATTSNNSTVIAERARIDSSGNLLVGTTTARAAITIEKDGIQLYLGPKNYGAGAEGGEMQFGRGTDGQPAWTFDALIGASPDIRLINASAVGVQLVNGATAWSAYSDTRLKKNIAPLRSVLTDLQQIECINYHLLNADTEDTPIRVGVSAQSLVGKFDEVVDNFRMKGDTTDYFAVRYSDMVPYLVKAIQEQQAIITSLTARVEALEGAQA
jgi:hypothetical protein